MPTRGAFWLNFWLLEHLGAPLEASLFQYRERLVAVGGDLGLVRRLGLFAIICQVHGLEHVHIFGVEEHVACWTRAVGSATEASSALDALHWKTVTAARGWTFTGKHGSLSPFIVLALALLDIH